MTLQKLRRRVLVGALAATTLMGITSASVAWASGGPSHATQRPANAGRIFSFKAGGAPTAVYGANNSVNESSTALTPTVIPGMTVKFTVNHKARVLMHFTDEAGCAGTTAGDWCTAEILVDGVEAAPGDGTDYAIDTSDGSGGFKWVGAAMNRDITVAAGTHTVQVVYLPAQSGNTVWSGENNLEVWVF